ncbi:DUF3472 domain-containing protein [Allorhodopirellula heiligendammensis]|uniref:DUF5077 domain-containing protein n=1 Tax=Allorhodopirellula heiligendammensis TaxID=2714739 RepID=A0A5C6BW51_9BACT|nr:DUF3472 domain-containing protein [Allorhodopirellula heiligendammensis]TWU15671.1 hypothetical protein Poly21_28680 [Allorhodopirellula heiligendammensis]
MLTTNSFFTAAMVTLLGAVTPIAAEEWTVPLAGNAFHRAPPSGRRLPLTDGALRIRGDRVYSVYFHVDRPGQVELAIKGRSVDGQSSIQARVGDTLLSTRLNDSQLQTYSLGDVAIAKPGYVRIDLSRDEADASSATEISDLIVRSDTDGMKLDFVQSNKGNMFYWGRRGPSVHLHYHLPKDTDVTYAYSEITVPAGQDAIGSYFMANGFGEGYFGMQVNSNTERRVLFSVWSPFHTDNPNEIPDEDRIRTLAKGTDVRAQDFGNEGSGGQSYMIYPWQAGATYRFLTKVTPDGDGNTHYTSWFGDKAAGEWRLIASFQRPKTDKHLTGFHSFLENFSPEYGNAERSAHYGNQWVRDTAGKWHEITSMKFTGDNTARARQRLDYAGGSKQASFFLRNCGFFDDQVALDQTFERASSGAQPEIDFAALPQN